MELLLLFVALFLGVFAAHGIDRWLSAESEADHAGWRQGRDHIRDIELQTLEAQLRTASTKTIGEMIRQLFSGGRRRPLGWNLIDAFTRLEEREEASNDPEGERQKSFDVQDR